MSLSECVKRLYIFLTHDLWQEEAGALSGDSVKGGGHALRVLRIFVVTIRGALSEQLSTRASALTYFTLLSLVPILALCFAAAKGFGLEQSLTDLITSSLSDTPEVATWLTTFAQRALDNAKGGIIAAVGIGMLLVSVFKLLTNIENAFNQQWGIDKPREFGQRVKDYTCLLVFAPLLLLASWSATVYMQSAVQVLQEVRLDIVGNILLKLLTVVLLGTAFTLLYVVMPNTKVSWKSALIAGGVAGVLFWLLQWAYITFQFGASRAGAIYGSFAFLPLLLAWVQLAWMLVLSGCRLCAAIQNTERYNAEQSAQTLSRTAEQTLALEVMLVSVQQFSGSSRHDIGLAELSSRLGLHASYINRAVKALCQAGLLVECQTEENEQQRYTPAYDIHQMSAATILEALGRVGEALPDSHTHAAPTSEGILAQRLLQAYISRGSDDERVSKPLTDLT